MAGTYENGAINIDFKNSKLKGNFLKQLKPDFTGIISDTCKGTMNFPDDGITSFHYDEEEYKIFWESKETGHV